MASKQKIRDSRKIRAPKLTRLVLIRVDTLHRPSGIVAKLDSNVDRQANLELLSPKKDSDICRLKVTITIKAAWTTKKEKQPIISFLGVYEGRFVYPKDVTQGDVKDWLKFEFNRQCIFAQVFPLANSHMFTQLSMMGLTPGNRNLGFDFEAADESNKSTGKKLEKPVVKRMIKKEKV